MKLKLLFLILVLAVFSSQAMAEPNRLAGERLRKNAKEAGHQLGKLDLEKGVRDLFDGLMAPFRWITGQDKE